jgi:cysteine desulfurase
MLPYFRECFGNPSAIYSYGQEAKKALEDSRRAVAGALGALNNEIYFTSGGTEGDNWAIHSACELRAKKGRHIITSAIEHKAVLRTLEKARERGFEVTVLRPDKYGQITGEQLAGAIRADTILASIMLANNVAGTVLPVQELCEAAHERGVLFHTDAVQAAAHIPINARALGVDMLSISAHKFHGPKGTGALFSRLPLIPAACVTGGGQEKERRAGTENVAGVVGMAAALACGARDMAANAARITALRDRLIEQTLKIPGAFLTGDPERRLPGHASFVFEGVTHSAYIINMLNEAGICASSGSACSASSKEASHVLTALGLSAELARSAVRISLSRYNTAEEIDVINETLPAVISQARAKKETLL